MKTKDTHSTNPPRLRGRAALLRGALAFAVLVGVALLGASAKGWSPRELWAWIHGESPARAAELWCQEHGVPESACTLCHPELKEQLPWCQEHKVPEAICTLCHPELAARFVVCKPHGLPEAFCTSCNATSSGSSSASSVPENAPLPLLRLKHQHTAQDAGIEVAPVGTSEMARQVSCNAEVSYNQNRYAEVRPRVEGVVREVRVDLGDEVRRGDVLALVDSAELGRAKADYLAAVAMVDLAQKNFQRIENLASRGISAEKSRIETESRLKETQVNAARARQALQNLGLSATHVEEIVASGATSSFLEILAPLDGVVVQRHAVEGEAVQATSQLFAVADLGTMWLHLELQEADLAQVRRGQPVVFQVKRLRAEPFRGTVTWISPQVDPRTRTVRVRAEVENRDRLLKANMFGTGQIQTEPTRRAVVVPQEAVQSHQGAYVVFVKKSDTTFQPCRVTLGLQDRRVWELAEGVMPGDLVVTTGSFLFKTELMKGSIGAGCCK